MCLVSLRAPLVLRVHMVQYVFLVFASAVAKKQKEYAVCLIRLSAPVTLGSSLLAQVFWIKCHTEVLSGVQLGKTREVVGSLEPLVDASRRIPALLTDLRCGSLSHERLWHEHQ